MSREVPFNTKAVCDGCGATGAYDFYGDYYCEKCSSPDMDMSALPRIILPGDQPLTPVERAKIIVQRWIVDGGAQKQQYQGLVASIAEALTSVGRAG